MTMAARPPPRAASCGRPPRSDPITPARLAAWKLKKEFFKAGGGRASAQGLAVAERLQKTFYFFEKRLESLIHYANV